MTNKFGITTSEKSSLYFLCDALKCEPEKAKKLIEIARIVYNDPHTAEYTFILDDLYSDLSVDTILRKEAKYRERLR